MDLFTKLGFCVSGALPRSLVTVHDSTDDPCTRSCESILNGPPTGSLTSRTPRVSPGGRRHLAGGNGHQHSPCRQANSPLRQAEQWCPGNVNHPNSGHAYGPHRKQMAWMLF